MKFVLVELAWKPLQGRAPQGARGLKYYWIKETEE